MEMIKEDMIRKEMKKEYWISNEKIRKDKMIIKQKKK